MALGVVAPLDRVLPVLAQTDQSHVLGQRPLDVLVARPCSWIVRGDLKKLERVVEFSYARDLQVLSADRLQAVLRVQKMIQAHEVAPKSR